MIFAKVQPDLAHCVFGRGADVKAQFAQRWNAATIADFTPPSMLE
jgi:hypothetical protein